MSIIHTTAPIPTEELRKYFDDTTVSFEIAYDDSSLQGDRLLTYLSNLEIPCDIVFSEEARDEILAAYFNSSQIVNVSSLEAEAIGVLLEFKGLTGDNRYEAFIEANEDIVWQWVRVLDSLTLYNLYMVQAPAMQDWVKGFPENDTSSMEGVNFVSVLKHEAFYEFFQVMQNEELQYYSKYFNEPIFKGKGLFEYWANEHNPMFLLTAGIASGLVVPSEYINVIESTAQEMEKNAAPV